MTRSPRRTASRTSWVTKRIVNPASIQSRSTSSWRMSRVMASSDPNGSSMSSTSARWASARARETRCRMPPDSSCGRRSPNPCRCTSSSSSATRCRRSVRGTPARVIGSSILAAAVSQGKSAASWKSSATWPVTEMRPASGWSRPETRLRMVVFPQPDAPTRHTNSPRSTLREMRSRASTLLPGGPYRLATESICTAGAAKAGSSTVVTRSTAALTAVAPETHPQRPAPR